MNIELDKTENMFKFEWILI